MLAARQPLKSRAAPVRPAVAPTRQAAGQHLLKQAVVAPRAAPPTLAAGTLPAGAALVLSYRRQGELAWQPVAGTIYVLKGTAVEFKVVSQGGDATLAPLVRLEGAQWSGLKVGRGKTISIRCDTNTANAAVPNVVDVTYGGVNATANVVVFTLNITATIRDNFAGRSATALGVCEEVDLGFTTTPLGLTAVQLGGLRWQFKDAAPTNLRSRGAFFNPAGQVNAPIDGTALYRAPYATHAAGTLAPTHSDVTIQLCLLAGPSQGKGPKKSYRIHKPQAHMTQQAGSAAHHFNTGGNEFPSAGFTGVFHFTPKNVSFREIGFREGVGNMQSDGVCAGDEAGLAHTATPVIFAIGNGDSGTGCRPTGGVSDNVHSAASTYDPTALLVANGGTRTALSHMTRVGGKRWPIVWEYTYQDVATGTWSANFIGMQKAYHEMTVYESGRTMMEKGHKGCDECTARVVVDFGVGAAHNWP